MRDSAVVPGDHARLYADGRIRDDARVIWEALEEHGPLATLELRHLCHMETKAGNVRFKRAMLDLQCLLVVVHFGSEQETGAWASGRFELTSRAFPKQTAAAQTHHARRGSSESGCQVSRVASQRASSTIGSALWLV